MLILACEEIPEHIKSCGASSIKQIKGDKVLPETCAAQIARLIKQEQAKIFLVESSVRGRDIAAQVAGILDAPMLSEVSSLEITNEGVVGTHIIYGGLMLRKAAITGFGVVTVQAGFCEEEAATGAASSAIELVEAEPDTRVTLKERQVIEKSGTDLSAAPAIICVGLGVEKQEDLELAEKLAALCGGAVGCTRGVAEDRHWMSAEFYIGISGKILNPNLYLGIAVSGQVQHTYGIRGAKIITAINVDENSPMVKSSDYAIIGDYKEILPVLCEAL